MSKRKPLPYHACEAIDQAKAENALAVKTLLILVQGQPISSEERYRRIGQAIHHLHESTAWLNTIRQAKEKTCQL